MLVTDPTFLGEIASVSGSAVAIFLASSVGSGLPIIGGRVYKTGQVGSFVRIPQGYQDLYGVVTEVGAKAVPNEVDDENTGRWIQVQLVGEALGAYSREE
ncbi:MULTISPECIES: hypothetical protein [unclassified Pseudovibrio]|uniref:hypothetical protein n=1 Tax=unclassified Pseudovibrio TaxID=2627060 RepID=UPI0007B2456B|nr:MULTISPECIES: hypothetical protein [unclassified Pseudovibrio]KZK94442.1 hypothetical protein PsW74_04584 [Pseudovibrio sp. W74]KZL07198.1 hypothetical protein PsAD14_04213 [Pseudovibrio sp. Ad14]